MNKIKFAVCDREERYVERLTEHFKRKQGIPFEVLAFTEEEAFWRFEEKNKVEFLMIESEMVNGERLKNFQGCVVILSEETVKSEMLQYHMIGKYQSCDQIFGEMMRIYYEQGQQEGRVDRPMRLLKKETQLFAVYSPVKRCGKTGFALTLGQILAEERPTLYLNLETIAGFAPDGKMEGEGDISDLIYLFRQDRSNFLYQLGRITKKIRDLDYIPAGIGWDLARVKTEEWIEMVKEIFQYSTYEVMILDFDENVGDLPLFLSFCTRIFMPILEEETAKRKVTQYEELIQRSRNTEIFEKTEKIKLPVFTECDPERLYFGKMGEFVRRILGEKEKSSGRIF